MPNLTGHDLGRYHILEQLGEGGMATVYKAYDTRLERDVAIKVIRVDQFAPAVLDRILKRFEREAKALARLTHPNIVKVYDYGDHDGSPYLVMEYLSSGTLKEKLGKPMPWRQAVKTLIPVARALEHAHNEGIVHRDVKPGNILITKGGEPTLSDFGIAKLLESEQSQTLTGTGVGIGTPEYMAPEQVNANTADLRADIYSLGVVFYEMVIGRKPFTADTPLAVLVKQASEPLPNPRKFIPDLPEAVESVLLKALAKNPAERYQNMGAFAEAMEGLLTASPTAETVASLGKQSLADESVKTMIAHPPDVNGTLIASALDVEKTMIAAAPVKRAAPAAEVATTAPKGGIRWKLWIPVGGAAALLGIALIVGAGFLIKGMIGKPPAAGVPTSTRTTNPVVPPGNNPTATQPSSPVQGITATPPIAATQTQSEYKVLWDTSHGPRASGDGSLYTPDGMYVILTKVLSDQKFYITGGDLSSLSSYPMLVLSATSADTTTLGVSEADAVEKYVRQVGGGLLILGDDPGFLNRLNIVSSRFGIVMGSVTSDGPVRFSNDPFFSGVSNVQFLFSGGILQVTSPAKAVAWDKNGSPVMATCECDAGRVMVIADSNLWDNRGIDQGNNLQFATKVFQWLVKSLP